MPSTASSPAGTAWLVLAIVATANFGNFHVYDSIGPVADFLQRERGFSDAEIVHPGGYVPMMAFFVTSGAAGFLLALLLRRATGRAR